MSIAIVLFCTLPALLLFIENEAKARQLKKKDAEIGRLKDHCKHLQSQLTAPPHRREGTDA